MKIIYRFFIFSLACLILKRIVSFRYESATSSKIKFKMKISRMIESTKIHPDYTYSPKDYLTKSILRFDFFTLILDFMKIVYNISDTPKIMKIKYRY